MQASQWVWQRTKSVSIPAEEQNAGRVVDYFYRMEFHITPRFFSDSNYLFFFERKRMFSYFWDFLNNGSLDVPGGKNARKSNKIKRKETGKVSPTVSSGCQRIEEFGNPK